MDRDTWNWIYRKNPFYKKSSPLVIIAEFKGRMVGSVSLIPSILQQLVGKDLISLPYCILWTAMVSPEWRNRGIFSSLLKSAIQIAKDEKYDLLLTITNNPYSFRGFIHAGFTHVTDFIRTKRYISLNGLFKSNEGTVLGYLEKILVVPPFGVYLRMYPRIHHDYEVRYGSVSDVGKEIEQFYYSNITHPGIYGIRTTLFTLWRFGRTDGNIRCLTLWKKNRLCAYLIYSFSKTEKKGVILDLFAGENNTTLTGILLSEAIHVLSKEDAVSLTAFQLDRDWDLSRTFSPRYGFFQRYSPMTHKEKFYFLLYFLDEKTGKGHFFEKNSWNIQAADTFRDGQQ
jgi:GNAT superfamily N-acetyltransferase